MTGIRLVEISAIWPRLIPSTIQIEECLAFLVVALGLSLIGALIRTVPRVEETSVAEADLLVGWSVVVSVFVVLGSFTSIPFSIIAKGLGLFAVFSAAYLIKRRVTLFAPGTGKTLLLLAPLFIITLSQSPSENDDLSQWLPNLRYLLLVDHFPGPGRPISDSIFPAYPYATSLVGYLTGQLTGTIPATAVVRLNLLLIGSLALLAFRVFNEEGAPARHTWRNSAIALASVTVLCPTFVPRLVLSNYADCSTAIAITFATFLMLRLCAKERPISPSAIVQTLLAIAVLILIKQANMVLLAVSLGGITLLYIRTPLRMLHIVPALVGAGFIYLAWRHQVALIGGGEMPIATWGNWQWDVLPTTLSNMVNVARNKGGYFGVAIALTIAVIFRREKAPLAFIFVGAFWGFTLFLTWVYLAVYLGYEGRSAASFWRYHTQLGGLQIIAVASILGTLYRTHAGNRLRPLQPAIGALLLTTLIVGPVLSAQNIRFDVNPSKDHVQAAVLAMAPLIPKDARLVVMDPKGSGFFTSFVRWHLGFQSPVAGGVSVFDSEADTLHLLTKEPITHLYVISSTPGLEAALGVQPLVGGSRLFERQESGAWAQIGFWPFQGFETIDAYKY